MVITQIGRKKLWGHLACLGDMQNIAKNGCLFAHFPRGAWGDFYKSWHKSNRCRSFRLILPTVNLTVQYLSRNIEISLKIIILPSCTEELRTAKRGNDLEPSSPLGTYLASPMHACVEAVSVLK